MEMKVNYLTDKENTQEYFSDNFRNTKKFVRVDHLEKITKNRPFSHFPLPENHRWSENFQDGHNQAHIDARSSY
jgi:hypothetical protein